MTDRTDYRGRGVFPMARAGTGSSDACRGRRRSSAAHAAGLERGGGQWYRLVMITGGEGAGANDELPPRVRRTLELVYGVEGVTAARVWQWSDKFAVGVRGTATASPIDLLRRVEAAIAPVREPGESWEFGLLDDESPVK